MRQALIEVEDPFLRVRLLRATGDLELYELAEALASSLQAPAANERAAAARALATMGELGAEDAIRALLDDPTDEVRQAAEAALQLLPERAVDAQA